MCFSNESSITFHTLKMVHKVGGFAVCEGGDGIGQVGGGASVYLAAKHDPSISPPSHSLTLTPTCPIPSLPSLTANPRTRCANSNV